MISISRLAMAVLALCLLLPFLCTEAEAAEQTITATVKVSIPFFEKTVLGTVVLRVSGEPDNLAVAWDFVGTVDGKAASAKGLGAGRWTGRGYEGHITKVETWQMQGLQRPIAKVPVSLLPGSNQTIWAVVTSQQLGPLSTPLNVQGVDGVPAPFQGDVALSVTNAAGEQAIRGLPRTGAEPWGPPWLAAMAVVAGGGLLWASRRALRRTP